MRIWSLHPKYLDTIGLVALWRETLLAKHVLLGKTKGYKNHPQLTRFKNAKFPVDSINHYLSEVYNEALRREFNFDKRKVNWKFKKSNLPVTTGQVHYEVGHLLKKLEVRDRKKYKEVNSQRAFDVHPSFRLVTGEIEEWEIIPVPSKSLPD